MNHGPAGGSYFFSIQGQKAIPFISRLNIAKSEALKAQQEMGGGEVDMETPFHEGGNGEKDGELSKADCKILRQVKSVKREGAF